MKQVSLDELQANIVFGNIMSAKQLWKPHSSWSFFEKPRRKHGFMYVLCDRVDISYDDGRAPETYRRGSLLYIPKGERYCIDFINTGEQYAIGKPSDIIINFEIKDLHGRDLCFYEGIHLLFDPTSERVALIFEQIAQLCLDLKVPHLRVSRYFYELLETIAVQLSHPEILSKKENIVTPAVLYLDNHITETISIPKLAHMCLLSTSAFRVAFKKYTGMTPIQYRMQTKILKAKQLLRGTDEPTSAEIADKLGFCDNTYFCRVFYKFTGQTPTQYRQGKQPNENSAFPDP